LAQSTGHKEAVAPQRAEADPYFRKVRSRRGLGCSSFSGHQPRQHGAGRAKTDTHAARAGGFRLVRTVPGAGSVGLGSAQSPHPGARSPSVTAARCKGYQLANNTKKFNYAQDVVVQKLNPSICEELLPFSLGRDTTFPAKRSLADDEVRATRVPVGRAIAGLRFRGYGSDHATAELALNRRAIDIDRLVPVGY
jgi:hypothetical protein